MISRYQQSAFSLVELSIVLVILGLLTGGILGGQALIRAAELRSVSTDYNRYATSMQTFRDKYFSIPGDFRDSTRFWGRQVATADCVTNSSAATNTAGTCDGNGDGVIDWGAAGVQSGELFQFWRHLANAGLIEGNYTGLAGPANNQDSTLGVNLPRSRISNAGWAIMTIGVFGDSEMYQMDYRPTMFEFGASVPSGRVWGRALRPEEAWNIDTKVDDGRPAYGKVIARYWNNGCAAPISGPVANTNLNATYRLDQNSIECALNFINR